MLLSNYCSFGVGVVGINIAKAASMVSETPIVGVDLIQHKLEMGKKFGLTHGVLAGDSQLEAKICNIVGSQGADVVIETAGVEETMLQAS